MQVAWSAEVGVSAVVTDEELRRWLTLLRRPHLLGGDDVEAFLRARGVMPEGGGALAVGQAMAAVLNEAIEALRPADDSNREGQIPYLVLRTCFVEGLKLLPAAIRLGMSERQLSRERSRAIAMLRSELGAPPAPAPRLYHAEPIPTIGNFVARPALVREIVYALADRRMVRVHGPLGIGKTSLVAEVASDLADTVPVLWLRLREGVNDSLQALLFELGEYLASQGLPRLSEYLLAALPSVDAALATRLALQGFSERSQLVVFDDFHCVEDDPAVSGLIEEMVSRLPGLQVLTVSRHRDEGTGFGQGFPVPPFSLPETRTLLGELGGAVDDETLGQLHRWTEGIPHLVKLAASWLKVASRDELHHGMTSLDDLEEVQAFLLGSITEFLDSDDRVILDAASIFRDRFTDDALAFVSGRTRGEVQDASIRLVRVYVATRSRRGDCSFFHTSVRDYVYARLDPAARAMLHRRAAEWYESQGELDAARQHAARASA